MKRAIVLSGGGARGSYQIGVWKALRKLHLKYDIVTGTSVGALNGALMAQKTYLRAVWFWYNINFKHIFKDEISYDYKTKEGQKNLMKHYAKAILVENGMDVTNLESTISRVLKENKIRKSKINFGLVTFNLSSFKPLKLTKDKIPEGQLKDYLMASATCFPAFKKKNIDNQDFIDGGYYDNLPINMAIEMGADEIIAVDLRAVGLRRRIKDKNVKITYIAPHNDLGSFLVFHKDLARRGIRLGYNDTMKIFDKLDGDKYTFKNDDLSRNFERYGAYYRSTLDGLFNDKAGNVVVQLLKLTAYKKDIRQRDLTKSIEFLGKAFDIDDSYIYDISKFNMNLIDYLRNMPKVNKKLVEDKIKNKDIKNLVVHSKYVIKYIYDMIVKHRNPKTNDQLSVIALLLPLEFLSAVYLYVIENYN